MTKNMTVKREFMIGKYGVPGRHSEEKTAAHVDTAKIAFFLADENDIPDEYVSGPLVERLHEFEKLGMEPEEIKNMMLEMVRVKDHLCIQRCSGINHYGMTLSERSQRKMIDDILDKVANEKNICLSIFISDQGTSIDVRPYATEGGDGDTESD